MKPLLKWVGGKRKFVRKYILKEIKAYKKFYEPFFGSGALFFELEPINGVINDLNKNLISFYEFVRDHPVELLNQINCLFENNLNKDSFIEIRKLYNESKITNMQKAAYFFFLNKKCFNGIYRVNSLGKYNVPYGGSTVFVPSEEELMKASLLLKKTEIKSEDWISAISGAKRGDLIYLDPPYYPDESSKFTGYTDPKFGVEEHDKMVKIIFKLSKKGVNIILSNSNSDEFKNKIGAIMSNEIIWKVVEIPTKRSINPNVQNKAKFIETLYIFEGRK